MATTSSSNSSINTTISRSNDMKPSTSQSKLKDNLHKLNSTSSSSSPKTPLHGFLTKHKSINVYFKFFMSKFAFFHLQNRRKARPAAAALNSPTFQPLSRANSKQKTLTFDTYKIYSEMVAFRRRVTPPQLKMPTGCTKQSTIPAFSAIPPPQVPPHQLQKKNIYKI